MGGAVNLTGSEAAVRFILDYVRPVGSLFIRLITMIAAPLVLSSLIVGAASVTDVRKLGRMGWKTFLLYLATTAVAISLGLAIAQIVRPGAGVTEEVSRRLLENFSDQAGERIARAENLSIPDQIVALVPSNPFEALASGNMLQIVFFALITGVALTLVAREKADPVIRVFDGLTDVLIKIVEIVMRLAPVGVFALLAAVTADLGFGVLSTLGWYALVVLAGLLLHLFLVYGGLLRLFVGRKMPARRFFRTMTNVQLLAFSSSSSAATLPLNMKTVHTRLGVSERVSAFVLPLGATINMDGTALYQGVAAVFIAQVYGLPLTLLDLTAIVATATLASIGTAAVPGAGIVMLAIVLQSVGIPVEGIALIVGIDRLLDMCRTVVNVTGDAVVSVIVAASEGELVQIGESVAAPPVESAAAA